MASAGYSRETMWNGCTVTRVDHDLRGHERGATDDHRAELQGKATRAHGLGSAYRWGLYG